MNERRYSVEELEQVYKDWRGNLTFAVGLVPEFLKHLSSLSQETEEKPKTQKYKFITNHHLMCSSGGGNIFRAGDVREYDEEHKVIVSRGNDWYPISKEELTKVAVPVPEDRKIEPLKWKHTSEEEYTASIEEIALKTNELVERFNQLQEEKETR